MPSIFKLKTLLSHSPNLSEVLNYFLRLTASSNTIPLLTLLTDSELQENDVVQILIQVVEHTAGDFLKRKIRLNPSPMLCFVEKESFYHGIFVSNDLPNPLTVFYFSDINKGLFSLSGVTKQTEMFRFSLMSTDKELVMNTSTLMN